MGSAKLDFKIDPKVFSDLLAIQKKLPRMSTGVYKEDAGDEFEDPAGLVLLGAKDGKLDTTVNLSMSGGCWDAPNVNHKDFDKGFRKMIESDRIVVGMALVRNPRWDGDGYYRQEEGDHTHDAKIPTHLRNEIHHLRNAFEDITKTAWIILHNDYFRIYRPVRDEAGRVKITEIPGVRLFDEEGKKSDIVAEKIEFDSTLKERKKKKRKEREEALKKQKEEAKKREEEANKREYARVMRRKKKLEETNNKLKEGKESIIDAGNGFSFIKDKEGKYILWQTGK